MNSETLTTPTNARALKIAALVLQMAAPVALAIVAGYGTVRYAEGTTTQKINNLEDQTRTQQQEIQRANDRAITRAEFQQFIDSTREDLREIKSDVRAIRSDLKGK